MSPCGSGSCWGSRSATVTCVLRGYKDGDVLPVLKIPAAEPLIADAGDWKARFETVKVTFSNRVGLISNTALRSGIIAYNESTDSTEREQSRKETETLAILTGLEIASVNWDTVTANLERLPYYAYMLEKETVKHIPISAPVNALFTFAQDPRWKDAIDPALTDRSCNQYNKSYTKNIV